MKKKAIKIAASTAVAASAFVAAAPAQQADAATNVNQLATDAQNAGTVLKWAISVEGSADFVTRPYDQYNAAKKAIAAAEAAGKKLSTSEKLSLDAKLVDAKLQVKRAAAYIDAITSSEKIKDLTSKLDAAIATGDIEKVEAAYHTATAEYRKQAKLLDRVYGQSTRDEIRNAVKPALEKSVASVKNEVTVNMLVKAALADNKAGKIAEAHAKIAEAQAILDANVLKWETTLAGSLDDAKKQLSPIPGNITVTDAAFHGEVGGTYAVVASFKDSKGAAYNGPVEINFDYTDATSASGYEFVTVNGVAASSTSVNTVYPVNGQLVLTVKAASKIAGGVVTFDTKPNGTDIVDSTTSGSLNFYNKVTESTPLDLNSGKVKYVDVANNYFVTTDLNKYVLSAAGSVYQDTNNAIITLDAFKAKLTKDDVVTGTYNPSGSNLKLAIDWATQSEFKLDQKLATDTTAYRVEGNVVTLSGSGEAGKLVSIYSGTTEAAIAQGQVASNGKWSFTVPVTADATTFTAYQAVSANEGPKPYSAISTVAANKTLVVTPGKFTVAAGTLVGSSDNSLSGDVVPFTSTKDVSVATKATTVIANNAQITVLDGDLTRATYVNGVNGTKIVKTNNGFDITFGAPSSISGGDNKLNGSLNISSVSGITNAYKLNVNVTGAISGY
ncbi:hypothetical protein [Psychrobacillus sp. FJAT-21963]|uniref:hypothetical protein n=1 Tax=Psychrobacillus sp. FJAT-21963 TaxID=1712028 RepID=UPI0006FFBA16|nr:hypothetical protein [Psychrobacillus sp. FJAT-21963]KQL36914.1 hypothetical protein AN959_02355 [Psychrobacillus sp. FJAT-21963]